MKYCLRGRLPTLLDVVIEHGSTALADHLKTLIGRHGSASATTGTLKVVEGAARFAVATPAASHVTAGMWFPPMAARPP
ncbi:hypothetical protein [Paraburkholderia kururiensis]|uniref:hypothetical protein n=1 Tax=Paraburkholderia kururiensis TaxID=984307 RepID=UPI001F0B7D31|nr:hypothetical protein [Paraburkholderia kururiensis]